MKIHIHDNVYLISDKYSFIVAEEKFDKTKDELILVHRTFHSDITSALKRALNEKIRSSKATTFAGLQKEYQRMNKLLEEIGKELSLNV